MTYRLKGNIVAPISEKRAFNNVGIYWQTLVICINFKNVFSLVSKAYATIIKMIRVLKILWRTDSQKYSVASKLTDILTDNVGQEKLGSITIYRSGVPKFEEPDR